jgi:hypothetical protein
VPLKPLERLRVGELVGIGEEDELEGGGEQDAAFSCGKASARQRVPFTDMSAWVDSEQVGDELIDECRLGDAGFDGTVGRRLDSP